MLCLKSANRFPAAMAFLLAVWVASIFGFASQVIAQGNDATSRTELASAGKSENGIQPVRTDSPRETIRTFGRLRRELERELLKYDVDRSLQQADQLRLIGKQLKSLVDLSKTPVASRSEIGSETIGYLLDIFGRVDVPSIDEVPDEDAYKDEGSAKYRIPNTPLRIARIEAGPRESEYLFSAQTVSVAPRFFRSISNLPLQSTLGIRSWSTYLPQLSGPLIPAFVTRAIPPNMQSLWLDTPVWKILAVCLTALIGLILLIGVNAVQLRVAPSSRVGVLWWRLVRPLMIILVVAVISIVIVQQINITGRFSAIVDTVTTLVLYASAAWLFWLASLLFFESIILSPRISSESLDANLLRLIAGTFGVVGAVIILAHGGQAIGLPILSVLAGLGIGGLGVALAIRPTIENLIGGVILYIDKPVRVGDFCSFGQMTGTVEAIGVRSTQIRGLDRTLVSVPNSQFADMEIVNWAECDEMLIEEVIGVRYETTPDQLRYLLAGMRELFHAHPRINSDTVRVRFSGYGDSALNITVRVYAQTREWNDFHAIREDIFLRLYDLVIGAGTGFAFPSQTIYMGQDSGVDHETGRQAEERVAAWRRNGQLPFPRYSPEKLSLINDTLDYPPRGSPEAGHENLDMVTRAEALGSEPLPEDTTSSPSQETGR